MIRLFLKFSIATILLGIFSRWLFFTYLESNVYTDRERVISGLTEVQLDGLRLLASELNSADEQTRQHRWEVVQKEFQSPIEIRPLAGEGVGGTSGRTSNYEATASLLSWRRFLRHCRKSCATHEERCDRTAGWFGYSAAWRLNPYSWGTLVGCADQLKGISRRCPRNFEVAVLTRCGHKA